MTVADPRWGVRQVDGVPGGQVGRRVRGRRGAVPHVGGGRRVQQERQVHDDLLPQELQRLQGRGGRHSAVGASTLAEQVRPGAPGQHSQRKSGSSALFARQSRMQRTPHAALHSRAGVGADRNESKSVECVVSRHSILIASDSRWCQQNLTRHCCGFPCSSRALSAVSLALYRTESVSLDWRRNSGTVALACSTNNTTNTSLVARHLNYPQPSMCPLRIHETMRRSFDGPIETVGEEGSAACGARRRVRLWSPTCVYCRMNMSQHVTAMSTDHHMLGINGRQASQALPETKTAVQTSDVRPWCAVRSRLTLAASVHDRQDLLRRAAPGYGVGVRRRLQRHTKHHFLVTRHA